MAFQPLEHRLLRIAKKQGLSGANWLVACSGGVDSMALVSALNAIAKPLKSEVLVAHFHHGKLGGRQGKFRDGAEKLVVAFADSHAIPHVVGRAGVAVERKGSEEKFREKRYLFLRQAARRVKKSDPSKPVFIVTAHHLEDLLETRLLRLIRGTGPQGLKSISPLKNDLWRPFLDFSKSEIRDYATKNKLTWIEDPSNRIGTAGLRNWLRIVLLPALETYRAGSVRRLALSLEQVSQALVNSEALQFTGNQIPRPVYLTLNPSEKSRVIASMLMQSGVANYSSGQVEEIRKRLDTSKNELSFNLKDVHWHISRDFIAVSEAETLS